MSTPLVSIIVPVYNAQNHIARCLESICAQSWQNIEVIVLNDGSKDQSLPVCEAFRAKDERIVLVDKANSGVSDTRNLGLKLASGTISTRTSPSIWSPLPNRTTPTWSSHLTRW